MNEGNPTDPEMTKKAKVDANLRGLKTLRKFMVAVV